MSLNFHYSSNVLQYFLISRFALLKVGADFMLIGTVFHSLEMSLLILSLAALDFASFFHIFMEVTLIDLPASSRSGLFCSSWKVINRELITRFGQLIQFCDPGGLRIWPTPNFHCSDKPSFWHINVTSFSNISYCINCE